MTAPQRIDLRPPFAVPSFLRSAAFLGTDRLAVAHDRGVSVLDVASGEIVATTAPPPAPIERIVIAAAERMAFGSMEGAALQWDLATGAVVKRIPLPPLSLLEAVDGGANRGVVATAPSAGDLARFVRRRSIISLHTERRAPPVFLDPEEGVPATSDAGAAFLPGNRVLVLGRVGPIRIHDAGTGELLRSLPTPRVTEDEGTPWIGHRSIEVSADGRHALVRTWGLSEVWDLEEGRITFTSDHFGSISPAFDPWRGRVAMPGRLMDNLGDRYVSVADGRDLGGFPLGPAGYSSMTVFAEDGRIASISHDVQVRMWSSDLRAPLAAPPDRLPADVTAVACSEDGATLLAGCIEGSLRIADARGVRMVAGFSREVRACGVLTDGRAWAASDDGFRTFAAADARFHGECSGRLGVAIAAPGGRTVAFLREMALVRLSAPEG